MLSNDNHNRATTCATALASTYWRALPTLTAALSVSSGLQDQCVYADPTLSLSATSAHFCNKRAPQSAPSSIDVDMNCVVCSVRNCSCNGQILVAYFIDRYMNTLLQIFFFTTRLMHSARAWNAAPGRSWNTRGELYTGSPVGNRLSSSRPRARARGCASFVPSQRWPPGP